MPVYSELELLGYYLVREEESDEIKCIQPLMQTTNCVLICHHSDFEVTYWKRKNDPIDEIVDELSDEEVDEFISISEDDDDDFIPSFGEWEDYEEDEDDEEDDN